MAKNLRWKVLTVVAVVVAAAARVAPAHGALLARTAELQDSLLRLAESAATYDALLALQHHVS